MRAWSTIGTVAVTLAVIWPTSAGASPAPSRALLLYGPDGPSLGFEERAVATFNLQSTDARLSPSVRHVSAALSDVPEVEVVGADEVLACPGTPVTAASYTKELDAALDHILYVRIDEAGQALERLKALLPCIHEPLSGRDLAQISFLEGIGLAYAGEDAAAREAFRQALLVRPDLDWEARFPPGPELLFRQAIQAALRTPSAQLEVAPQVGQGATLWVDGVEFARGGGSATLAEGKHLVQWRTEGGSFGTRWLEVGREARVSVYSRADVERTAITGDGQEACRECARQALTSLAAEVGTDRVYLAQLAAVDMLHVFEPETGQWELTDEGAVARRVRVRRQHEAGRGVLIGGGVVALGGAVVAIAGYARGRALHDEAGDIVSSDMYDEKASQYANARVQTSVGLTLAGLGVVAAAISIPLLTAGKKDAASPTVEVHSPSVAVRIGFGEFVLSGRF